MFINKKFSKKRIAVCENSFGNHSHFFIKGQVIDIITSRLKSYLFYFLKKKTPLYDFFHRPVLFPTLKIKLIYQEKIILETILQADNLGFFSFYGEKTLAAGIYKSEIYYQKINLLNNNLKTYNYDLIGTGKLTIFSKYTKYLFLTSDIDQTYLDTEMTFKGILSTVFESSKDKKTISKMDRFYKILQKQKKINLLFISASPSFFKRTLQAKFKEDGLKVTNIRLKYEGSNFNSLSQFFHSIINILKDLMSSDIKTFGKKIEALIKTFVNSISNHISYKLSELLKNRLYSPSKIEEILIGDNTESDALIFSLYQLLIMGKLRNELLVQFLENFKIENKRIFSDSKISEIRILVEKCISCHGSKNTVKFVFINQSKYGRKEEDIRRELSDILSDHIYLDKIHEFKNFHISKGAESFAKILNEKRFINKKTLDKILK